MNRMFKRTAFFLKMELCDIINVFNDTDQFASLLNKFIDLVSRCRFVWVVALMLACGGASCRDDVFRCCLVR